MATVRVEAQVSTEQLLQAVQQMTTHELDAFVEQVLALRAARAAHRVSAQEAALLRRVNLAVPAAVQQRYDALLAKRRAETLTEAEHAELLALTEQVELREADRVAALAELAQLRQTSLPNLMRLLGIQPPGYVS